MTRRRSRNFWGWLFVLPTVIGLIVLNFYPMLKTIWQSFHRVGDFGKGNIFVGTENFAMIVKDDNLWQSLLNTVLYTILEVPLSIALALVIAVLLNGKIKGRTLFRTIFFLPMVAAPAAIAMVWRWLYNTDYGLINNLFGIKVNWISDPNIALFSLAIIGIWSVLGYNMILFLAGLQDIPKDFYEAASIDGAKPIQQFFKITLPLISPMLFFVSVTRVISGMQIFDSIFMIMGMGTGGNPALSRTQSLVYLFYKYAFMQRNWGVGSAIVVFLLVIIALITAFQMIAQKKWVHYN